MNISAFQLIKKCIETKDIYLELGNCGLTDKDFARNSLLDNSLSDCIHLQILILSNEWSDHRTRRWNISQNEGEKNYFTICPSSIANLTNLTILILSGDLKPNWRINDMSFVKNLTNLIWLDISNNRIKKLDGLNNLSVLKHFYIYKNEIKSLSGIEHLTALQELKVNKNRIQSLTGIGNLIELRKVDFSGNEIQSLDEVEKLSEIREIRASKNIIQILISLNSLGKLEKLDIRDNRISDIKPLIHLIKRESNPLSVVSNENSFLDNGVINVKGNPLMSPPIDIVEHGNSVILHYFELLEKQGIEYLNEAKMLIVGQPRAGKTSLRYKLFDTDAILPTEDKTTRGIDIARLDFDYKDEDGKLRKFHYNIWDFGGQQIYHTTHQFFLTRRSLYVLVIDTGKDATGNDDTTVNYWLQVIELLGENSPLLLIRNEKNERQINIDIPTKKTRFEFLKSDYCVNLNTLAKNSKTFNAQRLKEFNHLKEDIEKELKRLPLVGFPMPKNWVLIRNELQSISLTNYYITCQDYKTICESYDVNEYERQMELSRIFHDLGVFLHFQDFGALDNFIILQNTWATDAVFAVLDNPKVIKAKGKFTDDDISEIWRDKQYEPAVHKKLLALMMKFELCYSVESALLNSYIIPEMLSDTPPDKYEWIPDDDLPLQYRYDFMPNGILTRFIVRMHKHIFFLNEQQVVWKTGVKINGTELDCPKTVAEITESWDNKRLFIRVKGPFCKDLMSKITFQLDQLNNEFFRQINNIDQPLKSKWYKLIPCNCVNCKDNPIKHFFDYGELLKRKAFGKATIECKEEPFADANIAELIDGVFSKDFNSGSSKKKSQKQTIIIFLASSSELKKEREQFEIFINRENKHLHEKGVFLQLEIWEDFLDSMSHTRLQDEYNKVIQACDIFVMLYFTKVGKYSAEEFENAFKNFKKTNKPQIYTYIKSASVELAQINEADIKSLFDFQKKIEKLGHFQKEFKSDAELHFHFKKQLERWYKAWKIDVDFSNDDEGLFSYIDDNLVTTQDFLTGEERREREEQEKSKTKKRYRLK